MVTPASGVRRAAPGVRPEPAPVPSALPLARAASDPGPGAGDRARRFTRGTALLLLHCLTGLVAWPWLARDIVWQRIPDALIHLVRIFVVDAALGRGQGYPRWLGDLYLGYGYPLLNYYAPGLYYLGAGLHRLGLSVYASLQWAGVLAAAGGAAGADFLARALARRADAARLGAAAYVLAPYPFYVNLYGRAAVPEALGLGLLPWLLLAGWRALYGPRRGSGPTLALAGLTAA